MKIALSSRVALPACLFVLVFTTISSAQTASNCSEISNDVTAAVSKDPSKVLMVVEDALVINEGCASDIVKAAIVASKADASLANQIVQTAVSVAPKMATVINDAANSVVPGLAAVVPTEPPVRPVTFDGKNPGKNPLPAPPTVAPVSFAPVSIRVATLPGIAFAPTGPIPPSNNPVSPSVARP